MTKTEELLYLEELLNKHGLPISPILEYAIQERKEQYSLEMDDIPTVCDFYSTNEKHEELNDYCLLFENLSVGVSNGKKLPHKAILLLSIMNLIGNGLISKNRIELNKIIANEFSKTWKAYMGNIKTPSVWTPFWYLKSESFWHFNSNGNDEFLQGMLNFAGHPTIGQMRNVISYASLDTFLFKYIQNKEKRKILQDVLIRTYL